MIINDECNLVFHIRMNMYFFLITFKMAMYGSLPSNRIQAISRNRVIRVEVPVFRK